MNYLLQKVTHIQHTMMTVDTMPIDCLHFITKQAQQEKLGGNLTHSSHP